MKSNGALALFDCDGTLIDSQRSIVDSVQAVWQESGLSVPDPASIRKIIGLSVPEAIAALLPDMEAKKRVVIEERCRKAFAKNRAATRDSLFPGIKDLLQNLKHHDIFLGVATGMSRNGLNHVLQNHALEPLFTTLQTSDQRHSKPHPDMAYHALAETAVPASQAVMIGDTIFDMEMAKAAGMKAIGVSWGYHRPEALLAAGALAVVGDAEELQRKILQTIAPGCILE